MTRTILPLTGVGAGAILCAGAATMIVICAAATVALTGVADDVRRVLGFDFTGVERTPAEATRIALHNGRLVAAMLLGAVAVGRLGRAPQALVDVVLATVLAANATLIGLALGAYGERLVASSAAHLPVEFAAFAVAGGTYLSARTRPLALRALASVGGLCVLLLAVAAVAETYAAQGALP